MIPQIKRWADHQPVSVLAALSKIVADDLDKSSLLDYQPYAPQAEFHMYGAIKRERMFRAGNQLGKTHSAGCEMAYHLTGRYPRWWRGRRWNRPILAWAAGVTGEATRDNPQKILFGEQGRKGTGTIPDADIPTGRDHYGMARGTSDLYDWHHVQHVSGAYSTVKFRYYAQDKQAWQGASVDALWLDEEPPIEIYSEGVARTTATRGCTLLTFTPLKGMSDVVAKFILESSPNRIDIRMRMVDALHIRPQDREAEMMKYPVHERKARTDGEIMVGSGRIYPVDDADLIVEPFIIPDFWPTIGGLDFGWDHPTAAVKLVHDRDTDTIYVVQEYRESKRTPAAHWAALRHWGKELQWAWPMDGLQTEKGSGITLAEQFRDEGMGLLHDHAQFQRLPDETKVSKTSREAGISQIYSRMTSGRFRVFSTLQHWLDEFRLYHRLDGKIVDKRDDLMDATRYAIMMLRYARTKEESSDRRGGMGSRPAPDWRVGF